MADDHFLSFVGAVSSVFNCSGRLFYGILMDKTNYKTAMTVMTILLSLLVSTLPLTMSFGKVKWLNATAFLQFYEPIFKLR